MDLLDEARAQQDDLVQLRRALHANPEIGLELPRTQERVLAALDDLPLTVTTGAPGLSSVVAVLRGGRSGGRSVLLRADMDALPVAEETGLDFAATNGAMHACGHDLHTSMLVGAARLLSAHRDRAGRRRHLHVPARRRGLRRRPAHGRGRRAGRGRTPSRGRVLHARRVVDLPERSGGGSARAR